MAIPASGNYPQYSGNIITPDFAKEILYNFKCKTIYQEISTTKYTSGSLERMGDQLTFRRQPRVNINDYQKGGTIIRETVTLSPVTMTIDKAKSFGVKFDDIDALQIQNFEQIKAAVLDSAPYELAKGIETDLLAVMYADVDVNNSGITAGVNSHSYNLGETGNPVAVSSSNIIDVLSRFKSVLKQQCADASDLFIVLPEVGENALMNSDLRAAFFAGNGESQVLNGRIPTKIMGFDVYISNYVPQVFDPAVNANCYQVVAGRQMATAFASQIDRVKITPFQDSWGSSIDGLAVYGYKVLYGEALAGGYLRFN